MWQNQSNQQDMKGFWFQEYLNRSPATIAVETSIFLLIGLIAIGGNLLVVIRSIYRNPTLRTITNYFVLSLAVSDILYPVASLPLTIVFSIKSRSVPGQSACVFQAIVSFSLSHVSVNTIAAMAINRFVCVCKPQHYKRIFNKKTSLIYICAIWITCFTLMTFNVHEQVVNRAEFEPQKILCGLPIARKSFTTKVLSNVVLGLFGLMPLSIIIYCYFRVFKKIREHQRNVAPASNPNSLGTSVQEIKVTWTMFAVLIGYCATWIPLLIVSFMSSHTCVPREGQMMVTYAIACSSAANPLIYGVMNTAFRREYKKIVRCH